MRKLGLLPILIFVLSCASTNFLTLESEVNKAVLAGRVINEEGLPLEGVRAKLDGVLEAKTDINGRFIYDKIFPGKHKLEFIKKGHTKELREFDYNPFKKKQHFFKVKMFSFNYLLSEGLETIKERDFEKTALIIKQLENIDPDSEAFRYLKALYLYKTEDLKKSMEILEELKSEDRKNIYYQLTLLKVYQGLKWYKKQADLYYYIAKNNFEEYGDYIKEAAEIYKELLENNKKYQKLIDEYSKLKDQSK